MPLHLLPDGQVPAHLTRIPIALINTSVDGTNRTVQVWTRGGPAGQLMGKRADVLQLHFFSTAWLKPEGAGGLPASLFQCVQGRVVHKGPLVLTAADAYILKAVVAGEQLFSALRTGLFLSALIFLSSLASSRRV